MYCLSEDTLPAPSLRERASYFGRLVSLARPAGCGPSQPDKMQPLTTLTLSPFNIVLFVLSLNHRHRFFATLSGCAMCISFATFTEGRERKHCWVTVCLSQDWSEDSPPPLDPQSGLATEVSALALLCAAPGQHP